MTPDFSGSALNRPHVLIVTDDRDLATFLGEGLLISGFWTSVVASGMQALELFRLRTFDAMVVDAAISDFPVLELVQRLRSPLFDDACRYNRPLLLLAGGEHELAAGDANDRGADATMFAPVELADVALLLFSLVHQWRINNPAALWSDAANFWSPE